MKLLAVFLLLSIPAMADVATDLQHMTGRHFQAVGVERTDPAGIYAQCHCNARALFKDGTVYLGQTVDLENIEGQAVLFHEYVHAMQWTERGNAANCDEWLSRENEAVQLERRWRIDHGARLIPPPFYRCKE